MRTPSEPGAWNLALDDPGSASRGALLRSVLFAAAVAVVALVIAVFGHVDLGELASFTTIHGSWLLVVDATTGWVLLQQFRVHRRPVFAILSTGYLVAALVMPVYVLAFPHALDGHGSVVGDAQSAAWIWYLWHLVLVGMAVAALVVERRLGRAQVPEDRVGRVVVLALVVAVATALLLLSLVTWAHDALPVMRETRHDQPLTVGFYVADLLLVVVTAGAMLAYWLSGWRRRTALHLWLAAALTAFLCEALANLLVSESYNLGWYLGRALSVLAASVLLFVFLSQVTGLHQRLLEAAEQLSEVNEGLRETLAEKDELVIDLRRSEQAVRELAFYDELTGLPNRRLLQDRAGQAAANADRRGHSVALLYLDLDGFKEANDRLGHEVGDAVLREVAARLRETSRRGDTVARVGGDEFVLLLPEVDRLEQVQRVADKVVAAVREPVHVGAHEVRVRASVGVGLQAPGPGLDVSALLRAADTAMYVAKQAGGDRWSHGPVVRLPEPRTGTPT